jgi:outer membrane protein insertion porin family
MGASVVTLVTVLLANGAAPIADRLAPYRGQRIESVDIAAPSAEDVEDLRSFIDIEKDELLSTTDLQAAIKRLYALGRFASVQVHAQRLSGAVLLRFELQPLRRLGDLSVDGVVEAKSNALVAALSLRPGDEVDRRTREAMQKHARDYLVRNGFPEATVTVEETAVSPYVTSYVLRVVEGPPQRVRAVRFGGERRVSEVALREVVRLADGDVLDRDALDADRARLEAAYVARGFLSVQVGEPVVSNDLVVTFPITAGPRIDVTYAGNRLVTTTSLRRMWPEPSGRMRSGTLRLHADRITKHYRRLGFNDARVSVRGFRDTESDVVRYLLTIDEGEPLRVASLTFTGARVIEPEVLAEQVRAVLTQQLQQAGTFQQLDASERETIARGSPEFPVAGGAGELESPVPPERRWVPELYEEALRGIRAVYRDRGFSSVVVSQAKPTIVGRDVHVNVLIEEGPQTSVSSVRFQNNTVLSAGELLEVLEVPARESTVVPLRLGQPLSATSVEDGRIALIRSYRDLGYLYAQIFAQTTMSADRSEAEVVYRIEEGPQVRIGKLLVRGNQYTSEGIIRSRITMAPGDVYRLEQAIRDQRAISELGVFSSVRMKLIDEERPSESKDMVAEVVERNRQPIEADVGVSTADGPRLRASYSHINVLGTASTLTLSGKVNRQLFFFLYGDYADAMQQRYDSYGGVEALTKAVEHELRLGLRSPRFTNLPLDPSTRLDLLVERENAIPFSLQTQAAILGFEFALANSLSLAIEPTFSLTALECPVVQTGNELLIDTEKSGEACEAAFAAERESQRLIEAGERQTAKLGPALTLDLRDNPFNPTSGIIATTTATYAAGQISPEDSDDLSFFSFAKLEGSLFGYVPISRAVLVVGARAGAIQLLEGSGVPIDERFFVGGRDTMRGYVEQTLIPQDACVVGPEELLTAEHGRCAEVLRRQRDENGNEQPALTRGGNAFLLLKTELRLPLTDSVSFDVFLDSGNLWVVAPDAEGVALRIGTGAGLRYNTPVGALALDVAVNPRPRTRRSEDFGPHLHLSIGSF